MSARYERVRRERWQVEKEELLAEFDQLLEAWDTFTAAAEDVVERLWTVPPPPSEELDQPNEWRKLADAVETLRRRIHAQ